MISQLLIEAGRGAFVGGLVGWLTNWLAVKMLFHPKTKWKFLGSDVPFTPGLAVKNRERLAEAIGEAIARDLLDADTVAAHLREVGLAEPIRQALLDERRGLAAEKRSLAELLGEGHRRALENARDTVTADLCRRAAELSTRLDDPSSPAVAALRGIIGEAAEAPLGTLLGAGKQDAAADWVREKIQETASAKRLSQHLDDAAVGLLERLPRSAAFDSLSEVARDALRPKLPELAGKLKDALSNYLGSADFEQQALDPLSRRLHSIIIQKFPMAAMLLSEKKVRELLEQRWPELMQGVQEITGSAEFSRHLETQIEGSIGELFAMLRGQLEDAETRARLAPLLAGQIGDSLREWLAGAAAKNAIRGVLSRVSEQSLRELCGGKTEWLDELGRAALGRLGGWIRGAEGQAWLAGVIGGAANHVLFRKPVGELIEFVPDKEWEMISAVLGEVFEDRAHRALPRVLRENVNLAAVVTAKISVFDTDQVEAIIVRVSGNELSGIVRLGGVLGVIVGAATEIVYFLWDAGK